LDQALGALDTKEFQICLEQTGHMGGMVTLMTVILCQLNNAYQVYL
jgi:hypothetical protein